MRFDLQEYDEGTALNQSAAGVGTGASPWSLQRTVRFQEDHVEIEDRLAFERVAPRNRLWLALDGEVRLQDGTRPDVDGRIPLSMLGVNPGDDGVAIHKVLRSQDHQITLRTR